MDWKEKLKVKIEELRWIIPDKIGLIFSGGLDSSFLAYISNMWDKDVHLYSAFTEESSDYSWVNKAAEILGLPLKFYLINEDNIIKGIKDIKKVDSKVDALQVLFDLPLYYSTSVSLEKYIVSGQGSDEIFLGYKKYEKINSWSKDLEKLLNNDVPREKRIGMMFHKELIMPYLSPDFMNFAIQIPIELKIKNGIHKYILREIATDYGLNSKIAMRPKKSAQYSSGVRELVEKLARNEGKKVYEFIRDL